MLSMGGVGMSVMEVSHRSKHFDRVLTEAEDSLRNLLEIPQNYRVLFLQGGAAMQFSLIPMNFLSEGEKAEYVVTGYWGEKALSEATRVGNAVAAFSTKDTNFTTIPSADELSFDPASAYIHYTSNETIDGVEFKYDLDGALTPVICDACSNILSKPIDVEKYAMIYAGAQKNIGPSGVTIAIIRDDMLANVNPDLAPIFDYKVQAENRSMVNTPNTWGIYLIGLVCEWAQSEGGLVAIEQRNQAKAKILYDAIDSSDGFYRGRAERNARSMMNVTFTLGSEELERDFCEQAAAIGLDGLAGHRSVGGVRASIYNAFPVEGVHRLVEFMQDFASEKA
jgi:phosphoserine aminotransferase